MSLGFRSGAEKGAVRRGLRVSASTACVIAGEETFCSEVCRCRTVLKWNI